MAKSMFGLTKTEHSEMWAIAADALGDGWKDVLSKATGLTGEELEKRRASEDGAVGEDPEAVIQAAGLTGYEALRFRRLAKRNAGINIYTRKFEMADGSVVMLPE